MTWYILQCLFIVLGYGWHVMVEGTFLLTCWFYFAFPSEGILFIFTFLSARKINFKPYTCPTFCLWKVQRRVLGMIPKKLVEYFYYAKLQISILLLAAQFVNFNFTICFYVCFKTIALFFPRNLEISMMVPINLEFISLGPTKPNVILGHPKKMPPLWTFDFKCVPNDPDNILQEFDDVCK